jgi:hypothetical protein
LKGEFDFLGPPRRIGQRFVNILRFEVGVELENLRLGMSGGDESDDRAHRDAQAANAGLAPHHGWIQRDSFQRFHAGNIAIPNRRLKPVSISGLANSTGFVTADVRRRKEQAKRSAASSRRRLLAGAV